jgi:COP9 signalosome complex subunit 7
LALSKSATAPRAAADLITRATSNPNTFLFTELLQTPEVQALSQSDEFKPYLHLLQVFSYGTYARYQQHASSLPSLNSAQLLKLRQLSLLTLARDRKNLSYSNLQNTLGIPDSRALEDLVISAIYANLIDASLDPYRQAVQVHSIAPLRDLAPGAVPPMIAALQAWSDRCTKTLSDLESQMGEIRVSAEQKQRDKEARDAHINKLVEESKDFTGVHDSKKLSNPVSGSAVTAALLGVQKAQRYGKRGSGLMMDSNEEADDEAMEVDDDDEDRADKKRGRKL